MANWFLSYVHAAHLIVAAGSSVSREILGRHLGPAERNAGIGRSGTGVFGVYELAVAA